jgi:signal transduction histidine kinase
MKYLFLFLLVALVSSANAQSLIPDSVRVAIRNSPDDSSRVKRLVRATTFLPYIQPDSALFYADSIIHFSERIDFAYGVALGYDLRAEVHLYKGDFAQGLYFNEKAMDLFELLKDMRAVASSNSRRGSLFSELGDHHQAIAAVSKSYALLSSFGDSSYNRVQEKYLSNTLSNLAQTYELAKVYEAANKLDSALVYAKESLRIDQSVNYGWVAPLTLLGNIYYKLNDYSSALSSYNTKAPFTYRIDSAKIFIGKAAVFAKIHQLDSCELYALKALDVFERSKFSKGIMQASEMLTSIYENRDPVRAIKYYKISNAIKDSLYSKEKVNQFNGMIFNNELRRLDAIAAEEAARNKYKILSLIGIAFTLLVAGVLLWRNSQHKKMANVLLQKEKQIVEKTLERLKSTQSQLIHSEKMASLGELTAGIAHEIQNPLNFVNNFSEVNKELLLEMRQEISNGNFNEIKGIAGSVIENEEKITFHGKRADAIVKGMLQHSRTSSGVKEPTDINALTDEYLRLAYHGLRAKDKTFNATVNKDFDESIGHIAVAPQDIGRAILNLITNAFYAVTERTKQNGNGHAGYEPTVSVTTKKINNIIEIKITDNGNGIPEKWLDKIFQPFFTTKPTGQGTGLGLSMSYDIVTKGHGGELKVETKEGEYAAFTIILPVNN